MRRTSARAVSSGDGAIPRPEITKMMIELARRQSQESRQQHASSYGKRKDRPGKVTRAGSKKLQPNLLLTSHEGKFVRSDDLAVQRAGDERIALGFASFSVSNCHAVDFEGAADSAFVVGFRFDEIG